MMEGELAIRLNNISFNYKKDRLAKHTKCDILRDISLSIRHGESLGIIGRNGSGKSTLLRLIAGILRPRSGVIEKNTGKILLLSYQLGFNNRLTGRENVIYSSMLQGMSRVEAEQAYPYIVSFADMAEVMDEPLNTYSSGMKARLGFSVMTQTDADIIMIDEALGVGDHSFKEKSTEFIKQWIRSNKTVVFVSHDENAVCNLCDRVVWLENGILVDHGSPGNVLENYYDFDHLVKAIASQLEISESKVRNHEYNSDPLRVISTMRRKLKVEWDMEDDPFGEGSRKIVKYFRPGRVVNFSQVAEECNGRWVWVEHGKIICRGMKDEVISAYNHYEKLVDRLANEMQTEIGVLRRSGLCRSVLELIEKVKK